MKLWKSKKSSTTSCVSAVSGKLNLSGSKNGYKEDDQVETIATPTATHLANGLHQGEDCRYDTFQPFEENNSLEAWENISAENLDFVAVEWRRQSRNRIFTHDEQSLESSMNHRYSNFFLFAQH